MDRTMTKKLLLLLLFAGPWLMLGCGDDNSTNGGGDNEPDIPAVYQDLPGNLITEDQTWSEDVTLAGPHFVLPGVTLTIEEGVTVSFEYHGGSATDVGTLIFLPADDANFDQPRASAKINAVGTASNPIVFTSARATPERNDWGGIILIGDAPNNIPGGVGEVEGLPSAIQYGGDNDTDDSGTISYVRIEYTGFSIAEGSEIQGLSLYSVGSGTQIDHLNIYECSDDGVELFGGMVDLKYVVIYGADDDSFDYDQGWRGRGQFWLAVQRENADNGFENDGCDDLSDCSGGNGPTSPQVYNVTVYGAGQSDENNFGLRLRENLEGSYNNVIVSNFVGAPFVLEGGDAGEEADATFDNFGSSLNLNSFIVHNNGLFQDKSAEGGDATEPDAQRYSNVYQGADPLFTDAQNFDFTLQNGSPALQSGKTPPNDGFFESANYIGAFGSENWAAGWARIGN